MSIENCPSLHSNKTIREHKLLTRNTSTHPSKNLSATSIPDTTLPKGVSCGTLPKCWVPRAVYAIKTFKSRSTQLTAPSTVTYLSGTRVSSSASKRDVPTIKRKPQVNIIGNFVVPPFRLQGRIEADSELNDEILQRPSRKTKWQASPPNLHNAKERRFVIISVIDQLDEAVSAMGRPVPVHLNDDGGGWIGGGETLHCGRQLGLWRMARQPLRVTWSEEKRKQEDSGGRETHSRREESVAHTREREREKERERGVPHVDHRIANSALN